MQNVMKVDCTSVKLKEGRTNVMDSHTGTITDVERIKAFIWYVRGEVV